MTPTGYPDPSTLRAVTVPLDGGADLDPLAIAGEEGYLFAGPSLTLAGRGAAAVLPLAGGLQDVAGLRDAEQWLAAVPSEDRVGLPGTGVVAQGALPFERAEPSSLVVPRLTFGRDETTGRAWATVVAPAGDPRSAIDPRSLRGRLARLAGGDPIGAGGRPGLPAGTELTEMVALPEPEDYMAAVAAAVEAIAGSRLRKVVLARQLSLRFASPVRLSGVLGRLHEREPACTAFSHPVGRGRFVGASPELLVSRRDGLVRCHPLAGTVALVGDAAIDQAATEQLLASAKDRVEHQLVVDDIARALRATGVEVEGPGRPSIVRLRSVAHLATRVVGSLGAGAPPGVLELLAALHPTPAVGGVPRSEALAMIAALEASPRQHWAGPVGWTDGSGNGDWMIAIRSALVTGPTARLWAGAGIVAGSDPAAELAETTVKFLPVIDAFLPGASGALLGTGSSRESLSQ